MNIISGKKKTQNRDALKINVEEMFIKIENVHKFGSDAKSFVFTPQTK